MPFKGYWYIIALGAAACIIHTALDNWIVLILFYSWLLLLGLRGNVKQPVLLFTVLATIFFMYYVPQVEPSTEVTDALPKKASLHGEIIGAVKETEKVIEFPLKDKTGEAILAIYFKHDEAEEYEYSTTIRAGAICSFSGELSLPERATNPHQFDYRTYLAKKGIHYQFIIPTLAEVNCSGYAPVSYVHQLRSFLLRFTNDKLSKDTVAWLHSLVLGDDQLLEDEIIYLFQSWGLSHLLAISGLHIGIIVGVIYFILVRFQLATKEKAQSLLLLFLPIYAIVAGSQPSVWRASLMVFVVILMAKCKWKMAYPDLLSIIFILLILFDPYIVYHVGFQLSFAVTFSLIVSRKWISQAPSNLAAILQISFVSQMAILPLQLHYFHSFVPLSVLLNLFIVPYFSLFVIPTMFILLFTSVLPLPLLKLVESIFQMIHQPVIQFIQWLDTYVYFPFIIGEQPIYFFLIYYIIFLLLMGMLENKEHMRAFQMGCLLTVFIAFLAIRPYFSPYGTVTMLDIGQGDAFVVELPYRKGVFLIDAGATFSFASFEPTDKVYRQIIRSYLYGQGIGKIDTIFLSHEDMDHDGSVRFIVKEIPVAEIVISHYYELDPMEKTRWENAGVTITWTKDHVQLIRNNQSFYVVSPDEKTNSANENSTVLYTKIGGLSWLFTGDIGKDTEKSIVKRYPEILFDVLKVGHHGSKMSTEDNFALHGKDGVAWISVGRKNSYGHPADEVIETLEALGMTIYRTDKHGAVQYRFKDDKGVFIPYLME